MMKLRGPFLAMGLAALIGLTASEVRAETIVMTIVTNGHTIPIVGGFLSGPATSQSFQVNTTALNATNDDGLPAQLGVIALLNGRVESVHVDVEDAADHLHDSVSVPAVISVGRQLLSHVDRESQRTRRTHRGR